MQGNDIINLQTKNGFDCKDFILFCFIKC